MTADPWPPLPRPLTEAEVGYGDQVAQGGSARVFTVLGERKSLLYKKYHERHGGADLDRLVEVYAGLDDATASSVRERLAWPVAVVRDGEDVVGALVVRAGPAFRVTLPDGRTRVRDLNFLLYEKRAERLGVRRATDRQKVELLDRLVAVLSWLDDRGFVHEDLAAHNVLWALDPPSVFVLDCDSLRATAEPGDQPLYTTVDWTDPRVLSAEVGRPDRASTSYVLGLLAARTLVSPYWHPGDDLPAERLPAALAPLVARATGPAGDRPSLSEWGRALDRALPQTLGAVVEPEAAGDPAAVRRADRLSFALGLLLGACAAVLVLARFV